MGEGEGREGRGSILVPPPGKNPMDAHVNPLEFTVDN
jgi:hypothetical protein